jgi:phage repressor protein C with HTH and peptisase S24 domain
MPKRNKEDNAMGFSEVWERVRAATGIDTFVGLAAEVGVLQSAVSKMKAKDEFPPKWIFAIARKHGLAADWLAEGLGPRRRPPGSPASGSGTDVPAGQGPDPSAFDFVPMAETHLSAGTGAFVLSESISDYYAFRTEWLRRVVTSSNHAVLMPVAGDSMEPEIRNGDVVMLDITQCRLHEGNIYALRLGDTIAIKRLSLRPGNRILVISDNKDEYPPYEADLSDIQILGKVVWIARTLNKGG